MIRVFPLTLTACPLTLTMTRKEFLKCSVAFVGCSLVDFDFSKLAYALANSSDHPALYWKPIDSEKVQCALCPRRCVIPKDKRGFCRVRQNNAGKLYSLVYSKPVAVHIDPIEKKPLFHFLPATTAFSIATVGCNLACKFCQNWEISQASPEDLPSQIVTPEEIVRQAKSAGSQTVAYTYTEPTVFYEYMLDTMLIARASGVKNIIHSAGFINEEPLRNMCKYLDAANIDLKGFTEDFYANICSGHLDDILGSLKILHQEKIHVEVTNLVIPTLNDDRTQVKKMCLWIKDNLGADVPLHFSRFSPMYKLNNIMPTPVSTLEDVRNIAMESGLKYVYIGNVPGHSGETTFCPKCRQPLIVRIGYNVTEYNLENGLCKYCKERIDGVWS